MFRFSKFVVVLLVLILATGAFAFAATNTMPVTTTAGEGSRTISGYTVGNVKYNLNATTPSNIDSVTFTLSPAATTTSTVKVGLVNGGTFYNCTSSDGTTWNCLTAGATVSASNLLTVIASD